MRARNGGRALKLPYLLGVFRKAHDPSESTSSPPVMARIPSGDTPVYPSSPSYTHPPIHPPPNPMASQGNGLWHPTHPQMAYQGQQGPQGPPYRYVGNEKDHNWPNACYMTVTVKPLDPCTMRYTRATPVPILGLVNPTAVSGKKMRMTIHLHTANDDVISST